MPERRVPGRSAVTRRAITDIVRSAVLGSYGIAGFASPRPVDHLVRWLRLDEPAIRVRYDTGLRVAVHVRVAYGLPVAEVARQVESAIRFAVGRALGREIDELTIHVDGLDDHAGGSPPPATSDAERATAAESESTDSNLATPVGSVTGGTSRARVEAAPDGRTSDARTSDARTSDARTSDTRTPVAPRGGPS
jgi:uncharacterized alkaline shock family protein YloU